MTDQPKPQVLVVSGRTQKPLLKKLNPLWWFGNEDNQNVGTLTSNKGDQAPWYQPTWPQWKRYLYWNYLRNPLNNGNSYVWGVQDLNYKVTVLAGNPDPSVHQRNDVGQTGVQFSILHFNTGLKLPWFSYSGTHLIFNIGWSPNGNFALKLHPTK